MKSIVKFKDSSVYDTKGEIRDLLSVYGTKCQKKKNSECLWQRLNNGPIVLRDTGTQHRHSNKECRETSTNINCLSIAASERLWSVQHVYLIM